METEKNNYTAYIKLSALLMPVAKLVNAIAPGLVKKLIKKGIGKSEDFAGELGKLNISLFKAVIEVSGFDLEIIENKEKLNFVHIDKIKLQLSVTELLKGRVVAKVVVSGVFITVIKDKTRLHQRGQFNGEIPLVLTSLNINDINVEYIDHSPTSPVKLNCDNLNLSGTNFTTLSTHKILPTKIECWGNIYGGKLRANINLDLSGPLPVFDLNLELQNVLMPRLNNLFSAYGQFKVETGQLSFYTEAAAKDGQFKGYVKPIITGLSIKEDDQHDGVLNTLWQAALTAFTQIFKNHKEDQIATKLPIEGKFSSPDIKVWYAIGEVLKNAFFTALKPSIDHEINIDSVKK